MDDTLLVRKVSIQPLSSRRVTTRFAPEATPATWPWLFAAMAILLLAAALQPLRPLRDQHLESQASELLRALP